MPRWVLITLYTLAGAEILGVAMLPALGQRPEPGPAFVFLSTDWTQARPAVDVLDHGLTAEDCTARLAGSVSTQARTFSCEMEGNGI